MRAATGIVVVVQENRFRLVTDDGRAELFVLAHDCPVEAQDLPDLQRDQTRVTVQYTSAPHWIAGLAHRLTEHKAEGRSP